MVDCFEMILERLAADRDPLLDNERRFGRGESVPLDRVRGVGQFQIVDVLEAPHSSACRRPQPVERRFLRRDPRD
jgi:hypothetical protein